MLKFSCPYNITATGLVRLPRILVPPRDTPQHSVMNEAIHSSELLHQCQAHIGYFIALLCFWMLICTGPYNVTAALVGLALDVFYKYSYVPIGKLQRTSVVIEDRHIQVGPHIYVKHTT